MKRFVSPFPPTTANSTEVEDVVSVSSRMKEQHTNAVWIAGSGHALPGAAIPNHVLEERFGRATGWIERKLGIRSRHWSVDLDAGGPRPGCRNFELGAAAARVAIAQAGVAPDDIDLLLVASASPDFALPAMAPLVQESLSIRECAAIDIHSACTGALQALFVASNAIRTGESQVACVIGSETPSLYLEYLGHRSPIDKSDFVNAAMFGDGAGAVIVGSTQRCERDPRLEAVRIGSVGPGRPPGISSAFEPASGGSVRHRLRQDYRGVLESGPDLYVRAFSSLRAAADIQPADVSLLVPHQANGLIAKFSEPLFGIPEERVFINADRVANCGAASLLIALDEALRAEPRKPGDLFVLLAPEASKWLYGGAVIRW